MKKVIQDLCLLLMFLSGWEDDSRQKPYIPSLSLRHFRLF